MSSEVSVDLVIDQYRQTVSELLHENFLLKARLSDLEKHLIKEDPHAPAPQVNTTGWDVT